MRGSRYLRLYGHFLRFSLSRAMEFRFDFFFRVIMDLNYYVVSLAFFKVIFHHTDILGGWSEHQVMVFVGAYLVVDAVQMTVIGNNMWNLPSLVNKGDLDYYLVRPVSSLFFVSLRDFAANSFINLLFAFGILAWALASFPGPLGIGSILLFVILVMNGTFLFYLTHLLALLPVFWMHSSRGLEIVFWSMSRFMERPDRIFTGTVRIVLLTVLPFSLMASIPARILFEPRPWSLIIHLVSLTLLFFVAVLAVWKRALRAYSSASS